MNRLLLAASLAAAALTACGVCTAHACLTSVTVRFADATGAAVAAVKGTVEVGGQTVSFDCATDGFGSTDAGVDTALSCHGGALEVSPGASMPATLTISASAPRGSFSGSVPVTYAASGPPSACGTCPAGGTSTVTLR